MEKIWLIKSSGRIIGPLAFDEIVQGLKSKEYVVLDEVAKPFGRWRYLRDEAAFEKVIDEMKSKDHVHSESTVTGTGTLSFTESTTEVITGNQEKTVHVLPDYDGDGKKSVPASKVFSLETDAKKWNRILSMVLVLIVLTIAFFYTKEKPTTKSILSYEETVEKAQFYKSVGDYENAKLEFLNAKSIDSDDVSASLDLSSLLIYFQDTVTAERILNQALKSNPTDEIKKKIYNFLGMIHLFHFNGEAGFQNFAHALQIDKDFAPALFNTGMTQYMNKNFKDASANYLSAIKKGGADAYIYVMLINATLEQIKSGEKTHEALGELIGIHQSIAAKNHTQFQEQTIAYSYVLFLLGKLKDAQNLLEQVLDSDPEESMDHGENLEYFRDKPIWYFLALWLKDMSKEFKSSARIETLLGFAYYKNKERVEGKNLIDHALRISPDDALIQAMSSYTASMSDREDEAAAILSANKGGNGLQLPHILKARQCMSEANGECAEEHWNIVLKINPNSLAAFDGLAQIALVRNNTIQAKKNMDLGLKRSPTYGPLLRIKKQIDEKN